VGRWVDDSGRHQRCAIDTGMLSAFARARSTIGRAISGGSTYDVAVVGGEEFPGAPGNSESCIAAPPMLKWFFSGSIAYCTAARSRYGLLKIFG
jgi:hypothetical protein